MSVANSLSTASMESRPDWPARNSFALRTVNSCKSPGLPSTAVQRSTKAKARAGAAVSHGPREEDLSGCCESKKSGTDLDRTPPCC